MRRIIPAAIFLAMMPAALADGFIMENLSLFLIIIFGIFSFVAYIVVTYIVHRVQGAFGPWIIYSVISLLLLATQFTIGNIVLYRRLMAGVMFLFFAAALFRYWDAIELGQ